MGSSKDYANVAEWKSKDTGYHTGDMVRYKNNIFRAAYWAGKEPGVDPGWSLYDELYDQTSPTPTKTAKIIGYLPTWRTDLDFGSAVVYQNITHGIIAFLNFDETKLGELDQTSVKAVTAIVQQVVTTAHKAGTYISIAIGGAVDYGFLNLLTAVGSNATDARLDKAVQNVTQFVKDNALDGVDLDLECWWDKNGDASKDQGGRDKSKGPHPAGAALVSFAQKLKSALPGKLVSATLFATSWYGNAYDPKLADQVDWLSIMSYDLTGSWNQTPVGPHTALYKIRKQDQYKDEQQGPWPTTARGPSKNSTPMDDNPIFSVEDSLWYWSNPFFVNWQGEGQKVARNKLVAGVPLYGYDFAYIKDKDPESGQTPPGYKVLRYKELVQQFPGASTAANANIKVSGNTPRPSFVSAPGTYPYAHNIYLETPDTAVAKLKFLNQLGLQGVIIWEMSNEVWDDGKSIVKALYQASGNPATRPALPAPQFAKPPVQSGDLTGTGPVETASHYLWDATGFLGVPTTLLQFKDDGVKRPGARQFSARLWNVPLGVDWKTVAAHAPAVIKRQYFNRPTRIVDKGVLGLWGEFDVRDTSDVPDWYWGHMETVEGAPSGFKRYRSRLWGLSLRDDWKAAARKTPALIEGQYFDQPTEIDDRGINGLYGVFDVSNGPSTVPAPVAQAQGPNDCSYCLIDTTPPQGNVALVNLTSTMTVTPGTPYLYAVLTRDDDSVDFPAGVVMTIQDPSGANYDHDIQDDNQLVMMSGPSVRCLIVKDPKPGDWTMAMSAPSGVGFHCECDTAPNADIFDTMVRTRQQLGETQGLVPRDISVSEGLAYLAAATITLLIPLPLSLTVRVLIWVTGVGLGIALKGTSKVAVSQNMAEVVGILSKIAKDVQQEGYSAFGKYVTLIGKNISLEEYQVILRYPGNLFHWLGVHRRVYQVVEHMTDAEEQNAVRHVYWQCLLKKRLGEEFAIAMGDAHERGRPGSDADNKADEVNNKIGLQLADQIESEEECLQRAVQMWQAGQLATRPDFESDPT